MSDHCETVSAVLGLYAEGELHDPRAVELVREHLMGCVECRGVLEFHDGLTRTLLAGEPERLPDDGVGWVDLERERRVEGVLRRLNWSSPAVTVTEERVLNGSRAPGVPVETSDALEAALFERPGGPRLRLSLDDLAPDSDATTGRRTFDARRASRTRSLALAAAALIGISVCLAAMLSGTISGTLSRVLSGNAPDAVRRALLEPPRSSPPHTSSTLVVSGGQSPYDLASPRRDSDRSLRWVVRGDGVDPPFRLGPSSARARPSATELLYGVDYRRGAPALPSMVAMSPPPDDTEIEWVVEVVIIDAPSEQSETLSEPRYLLVPEVSELARSARSGRWLDAGGVWFQPGRIERRRARDEAAPRLTIGNSTVCRVCVYEGIRRLELPDQNWTPVRWRTPSTFGGAPRHRVAPRPLPTFSWRSPDVSREPNLRF